MNIPDQQGYVRVGGKRLFYRRVGERLRGTILVLHGGPGFTHEYLMPLADLAGAGYEVVFYDQLGCAKSERPLTYRDYKIRAAADEADALRLRLKLGRVHLFGHSYGGALALEAAVRHPRAWRSLVVSGGFASMRSLWKGVRLRTSQLLTANRRAFLKEDRTGVGSPGSARALEEYRRRFQEHTEIRPFEVWLTFQHANWQTTKAMGMWTRRLYDDGFAHGTMAGWDLTAELARIRIPTLVTVGQFDHVVPACAREIHQQIPGSRLWVARGEGHLPFFENRDRYVTLLRGFFDHAG